MSVADERKPPSLIVLGDEDNEATIEEFVERTLGEVAGKNIDSSYAAGDMHFLCGCVNFDPYGYNEVFKDIILQHFLNREHAHPGFLNVKVKVRSEVPAIMALADQKAKELKGPGARCRVWKTSTIPLKESNWSESLFKDVTDNGGMLKKCLERALRTGVTSAQKHLGLLGRQQRLPAQQCRPKLQTSVEPPRPVALTQQPSPSPTATRKRVAPVVSFKQPPAAAMSAMVSSPKQVSLSHSTDLAITPEIEAAVKAFVEQYKSPEISDAMERLDFARGQQNIEEWAKSIYVTLRGNPFDEHARKCNLDRRALLKLLYDLVNKWQEFNFSAEFEHAILRIFQKRRLTRILAVCLPMDRAQALYRLRCGTETTYGIPWWCEFHCESNNTYARDFPEEQAKWRALIDGHPSEPTMNKRLFRLLFSDVLCLRKDKDIMKWSRPAYMPNDNGATNDVLHDDHVKPPPQKKQKLPESQQVSVDPGFWAVESGDISVDWALEERAFAEVMSDSPFGGGNDSKQPASPKDTLGGKAVHG